MSRPPRDDGKPVSTYRGRRTVRGSRPDFLHPQTGGEGWLGCLI